MKSAAHFILRLTSVHDAACLAARVDDGAVGGAARQHRVRPQRVLHIQRLLAPLLHILRTDAGEDALERVNAHLRLLRVDLSADVQQLLVPRKNQTNKLNKIFNIFVYRSALISRPVY